MSEAAGGSAQGGQPGGAGAAGGTGGAGDAGAAGGAGAAGAALEWTGSLADEVKGFVQTKGWKGPADVIGSYQNLEKLLGADKAGRAIVPPKDDAPPEEWAAFYGKLGRPDAADGYKIPVPEGGNPELAKAAAGKFHELGLSAKQAEGLATWWNEHMGGTMQQQEATFEQQAVVDMQDLEKEWGDQFEAQSELARRAIREAGLTKEEGQKIERALGLGKAAKVFAFLGKQFAEAPMKGGEGATSSNFGTTPEAAKSRIQQLQRDRDWSAKYLKGDADARAEFERLHKIAYPGT